MIYFVTVNYYSTSLIKNLLDSIELAASEEYQFLVVNNSPEETAIHDLALQRKYVKVLTAEKNLGFGGGCNLGIQYIYEIDPNAVIWLINPDALIEPIATSYIRECLIQEPEIAILGTRIQDWNGDLWFSLGTYNPWLGSLKHQFNRVEISTEPVRTFASRWVSGCSLIINLAKFSICPLFDTQYFLDYEDADLCERCYQQGYRIRVTQAALVKHMVSAITHRNPQAKFQHATFSKLYFLHQHGTALALGLNLLYIPVKILWVLPRHPKVALGRWYGFKDFMKWKIQCWLQPHTSSHFTPQSSFTSSPKTTTAEKEK